MYDGGHEIIPADPRVMGMVLAKAQDTYLSTLSTAVARGIVSANSDIYQLLFGMVAPEDRRDPKIKQVIQKAHQYLNTANAMAKAFRADTRGGRKTPEELVKSGAMAKSTLDVGTLTNFASITGGQSLGYVSLDTQLARATVRPNSFTLYQALHKSAAFQVVDYWASANDIGSPLPGGAFQGFGNVSSGTLSTNAGVYALNNVTLKLALDGRAITTALAAQNSFVDISAQENINAALAVLQSIDWACYWGASGTYANQFQGIAQLIPSGNVFDYQVFKAEYAAAAGWTDAQTMFNLIYQAAAQITSWNSFGRVTHAFMAPDCAGTLQQLTTTLLNNIVNEITARQGQPTPIVINGDLQGMRTRFGDIQFPVDLIIPVRDRPAQSISNGQGGTYGTTTSPAPVTSVTAVVSGATTTNSSWTAAYVASSGIYSYAVAAVDGAMNESNLTYLASGAGVGSGLSVSGIILNGAVTLTITPAESTDTAFRVYRSGLGYSVLTSGAQNPAAYRYVGTVNANGGSAVAFVDKNSNIPGSDTVFLLDMDEQDMAIDFRFLLPLSRIELFAQNLYMPWAVAMIGALRLKIPKFHGLIKNFVPDNASWNPLNPNTNAA